MRERNICNNSRLDGWAVVVTYSMFFGWCTVYVLVLVSVLCSLQYGRVLAFLSKSLDGNPNTHPRI